MKISNTFNWQHFSKKRQQHKTKYEKQKLENIALIFTMIKPNKNCKNLNIIQMINERIINIIL